ncbi:MAG: tetratricopeptide repeat protein, partial [Chloroflexia bacterium]|nr:tetratricopeptide repeat protein [Chloroflexia bacterium]
ALDTLARAIDLDPANLDARHQLALVLATRGDQQAAWQQLATILRLQPGHPAARLDAAVLLLSNSRFAEAHELLEPVYATQPANPRLQYYMAAAWCGSNDVRGVDLMRQLAQTQAAPYNQWAAQFLASAAAGRTAENEQ